MKPVKRLIAIVALVCLCLTVTACSSGVSILGVTNPTTPIEGAVTTDPVQNNSGSQSTFAYRNDFFNFECVLPDEWYVLNAEEMANTIGVTYDMLGDSTTSDIIQQSFDSGAMRTEMMATKDSGTKTISISLSKSGILDLLLPEQHLMEASSSLLTKGLEDMGVSKITHYTEEYVFLNEQHITLVAHGDFQGNPVMETFLMLRKGFYLCIVVIMEFAENPTMDYPDFFQPID